jgi:hypothetical protein
MLYTNADFKNMKFPIFELPLDQDLLVQFKRLQSFPAFKQALPNLDINLVMRYIFFCYDQSIQWDTLDFKTRKKKAIELAGFKKFDRNVVLMLNNAIPEVNQMIVAFFQIQNNRKLRRKIMALELLDQYHKIIMEPIRKKLDDDKRMRAANLKTKLMEDCETLDRMIDGIDDEYFGSSDEALKVTENLVAISPENISKMTDHVPKN